ncbi:MAG TPA: FlgD immunoglobulin-like domain containing protein [Candidatus Limnocylindrales bacterium]
MRRPVTGFILAALCVLGSFGGWVAPVTPVAAASPAKVVIIVGPVGSMTASYLLDADAIAAAARQYTPDVTQLYTPNATWAAARAALQGANIVVYLGHGNGFPSPYSTTLQPTKQDGLGLNPVAGGGDTTTQYWGESYLASDVRLAPNAVVLLHHLCYASGNSEPGRPEPTLDVAIQRVDNMAAGWLAAGARTVIADAHYGSAYYMNALFTTHETLDAVWRGAPRTNGNYQLVPSARTSGMTLEIDPDQPASGYYRSFAGDPALTTDAVLGSAGATGPTGPTAPAAPGDALSASLGLAAPPLDVTPPILVPVGASALARTTFSPNGDGVADTVSLPVALGEAATLDVRVNDGATGAIVRAWSVAASAGRTTVTWDGRAEGGWPAPDGTYVLTVSARDGAGNAAPPLSKPVAVFRALGFARSSAPVIWPADPTGMSPAAADLSFVLASAASVTWTILDPAGRTVATHFDRVPLGAGAYAFSWDGRDAGGNLVPPGSYRASVIAAAGGLAARLTTTVAVGPYGLSTSSTVARRGTTLSLTALPSVPGAAVPMVVVSQPGLAPRIVPMIAAGAGRFTARIAIARARDLGLLQLTVTGAMAGGTAVSARLALPLR